MTHSQASVLERSRTSAAATAVAQPRTRNELIDLVSAALRRHGKGTMRFKALYRNMELTSLDVIKALPTTDSALEPVVMALNEAGMETGDTAGDVMRVMSISEHELHTVVCHCYGEEITGNELANRFDMLKTNA